MPPLDETRAWLHKARNDLRSAQILVSHDEPVFDTAAFHCQQAAEKALKEFLTSESIHFEKVHSLTYLLELCEALEAEFGTLRNAAAELAPFAVEIRYPGDLTELSAEEAQGALSGAEAIYEKVLFFLQTEL